MKSLRYIFLPIALVILALMAGMTTGCNTTGCTENQNSVPLAGFYSYNTGEAISIDSLAIGGLGAPGDSLLVAPSARASSVYLPFRSTESYTTFTIRYMQKALQEAGVYDQITFYYESQPWFASEECGAMYHYRITRVAHTYQILDSVGISDSLITNIEREDIRLFFRTASDGDDNDTGETPGGEPGDETGGDEGSEEGADDV